MTHANTSADSKKDELIEARSGKGRKALGALGMTGIGAAMLGIALTGFGASDADPSPKSVTTTTEIEPTTTTESTTTTTEAPVIPQSEAGSIIGPDGKVVPIAPGQPLPPESAGVLDGTGEMPVQGASPTP